MNMDNKKGHWESPGMCWDEGDDTPICSYCGVTADKDNLQETNISGGICCEKQGCLNELALENLCGHVEFIEE